MFNGLTTYQIYLDPINGLYAVPLGDYEGGPHSNCYGTFEELWEAIYKQEDNLLWGESEE